MLVWMGFEGWEFCGGGGGGGGVGVFLKNPVLNHSIVVIPFHMMLCILL